jgi:Nif-specific regulatory protein
MRVQGDMIDVRDLPAPLRQGAVEQATAEDEILPLSEVERRHTLRVLEQVGGNKVKAAEALQISRATLYRILGEAAACEQGHSPDHG